MNMLVMIKDTLKANRSLSRAEADWLVEEIQRLQEATSFTCLECGYIFQSPHTLAGQVPMVPEDVYCDKCKKKCLVLPTREHEFNKIRDSNMEMVNYFSSILKSKDEEIQRLTAEVERLERVRQKFIRENRSKGNE